MASEDISWESIIISAIISIILIVTNNIISKWMRKREKIEEKNEEKKEIDKKHYKIISTLISCMKNGDIRQTYEIIKKNIGFFKKFNWTTELRSDSICLNNGNIVFRIYEFHSAGNIAPTYQVNSDIISPKKELSLIETIEKLLDYFEKIKLFDKTQMVKLKKIYLD